MTHYPAAEWKDEVSKEKGLAKTNPTLANPVQPHDILYKVSRDIPYSCGGGSKLGIQRSTIVERWIPGSSSRISVVQ